MKTKKMETGYFGKFGGQLVPEEIAVELNKIADFYTKIKDDPEFKEELANYLKDYSGRKTPLYYADVNRKLGGAKIYLKREDLNHLGSQDEQRHGSSSWQKNG